MVQMVIDKEAYEPQANSLGQLYFIIIYSGFFMSTPQFTIQNMAYNKVPGKWGLLHEDEEQTTKKWKMLRTGQRTGWLWFGHSFICESNRSLSSFITQTDNLKLYKGVWAQGVLREYWQRSLSCNPFPCGWELLDHFPWLCDFDQDWMTG